jgi:hypothetical protein
MSITHSCTLTLYLHSRKRFQKVKLITKISRMEIYTVLMIGSELKQSIKL